MNEVSTFWLRCVCSLILAGLVCYFITPQIIRLANKIGAVDIPKDNRRMHHTPIPRLGGLGIFAAFLFPSFSFSEIDLQFFGILAGASLLIILGVFDDIYSLNPWIKLIFQFLAAMIPVLNGLMIQRLTDFTGKQTYIELGYFAIPITLIWIVGITNAVNWIDGLDGLACGISIIACISMFVISVSVGDYVDAIIVSALLGSCFGFLPYNHNPARIFMGDTGSMFLGYMLAVLSVSGMFKLYAVISFVVPLLVLALPLADMIVNIIRRIVTGHSPMQADRGHIHHRLVDIGLSQKQAVLLLYIVSAILGCCAMLFTFHGLFKIVICAISLFFVLILSAYILVLHKRKDREGCENEDHKK